MPFFTDTFTQSLSTKSSGDYLNPSSIDDGQTVRFSILSDSPLEGFECWFTKPDGKMTKRITPSYPDEALIADLEEAVGGRLTIRDGKPAIKASCSFFVYNYDSERVELFSANQKSLLGEIARYTSDEDYADLSQWDMKLARTGKGTDTKYHLSMVPSRRATPSVSKAVTTAWLEALDAGYSLEPLLSGGSPFGASDKL